MCKYRPKKALLTTTIEVLYLHKNGNTHTKTAQVKIGYLLNKSVVKIGCQKITQKNTKKLLQFVVFWKLPHGLCVFSTTEMAVCYFLF